MKKIRRILVMVLLCSVLMSLAACAKKPIDEETFEEIMESEFDFDLTDLIEQREISGRSYAVYPETEDSLTTHYIAQDEDYEFVVYYALYTDSEEADKTRDIHIDRYERHIVEGSVEGEIEKKLSDHFSKVSITGKFIIRDIDFYSVFIQADDMTIYIYTYSVDSDDVDYVNKIVKELGY